MKSVMSARADILRAQIDTLARTRSFAVFAAFLRDPDAGRWIARQLSVSTADFRAALVDLDNRRADYLPATIDDLAPHASGKLRAIFEFVKVQLRKRRPEAIRDAILRDGSVVSDRPEPVPPRAADLPAFDLPADWKLALPVPPPQRTLAKTSPTRFDSYLRCPFTYYLHDKSILGDLPMDARASELAAWEFGNLVHGALERFGSSDLKDSSDADAIAAFLASSVDALLAERFGAAVPDAVACQGADARRRLADFAVLQSARRASGWRIVAAEKRLEGTIGHVLFAGKCDRIDFNERTGAWCVIDYKTWGSVALAARPSVQLPLYRHLLSELDEEEFASARADVISCLYCVLGRTRGDVAFVEPADDCTARDVVELVGRTVPRIESGIFWPPSPSADWRRDFAGWLGPSPFLTVGEDWIRDQERRLDSSMGSDPMDPDLTDPVATQVFGSVALSGFLDLLKLADHPGDRLTYRHFRLTHLAQVLYPDGVPPLSVVSREAADAFAAHGIVGAFRDIRARLPDAAPAAWSDYTEACFAEMLRAASAFERNLQPDTLISDFASDFAHD